MGYYSTMSPDEFLSSFSPEEVTEKYKQFVTSLKNSKGLQELIDCDGSYLDDDYIFTLSKEKDANGLYLIALESSDGDYNAKHYNSEGLAFFISTVISEGSYCELTFEGEDGECWGWRIGFLELQIMEKEWSYKKKYHWTKKQLAQALLSK
jgi:hypothetical protein